MENESMSSKKTNLKTISLIAGTAFVGTLAASTVANAAENPFGMSELKSGYMQLADSSKGKEGKCGEGKCGEGKKADAKSKEGKCGEGKCGEGKCGADKKAKKEGKCGGDKKAKEGKCGEGKCGGKK